MKMNTIILIKYYALWLVTAIITFEVLSFVYQASNGFPGGLHWLP